MIIIVSKTGAIRIPAELRKRYKLKAGSKLVIVDYGGRLVLVPAVEDAIKKGYDFLKEGHFMADDLKRDRELEEQRDLRLSGG